MARSIPASMLGMIVSGDLAGMTIYTDRFGRKTWYAKAPPRKPPSPMQVKQRARFAAAVANWNAAAHPNREAFERITLKASLNMTGHDLWVSISLTGKFGTLATLQRQTGITVTDPPFVPWPE